MRIKHNLWRVSNGWLLVPEGDDSIIQSKDASQITVFKTLKEFAETFPKRERKRNRKPLTTKATEPQHTLD
jgi:hypothetical protein